MGYFRELVQGVYKQISFAKQPVNVLRTCPLVSISPCMDTIASTLQPVKLTHSVTAPSPSGRRQAKGKGVRKGCKVKYADLQRNLYRSWGNLLHFPLLIKIHRVPNMGCGLFETFPQSKSMCT